MASHWGIKEVRKSIDSLFKKNEDNIITWFDNANTIEDLIDIAEQQISVGKYYLMHHPAPQYVLAFLLARANQIDLAIKQFDALGDREFNNDQDIKEKLKGQLIALAERKNANGGVQQV